MSNTTDHIIKHYVYQPSYNEGLITIDIPSFSGFTVTIPMNVPVHSVLITKDHIFVQSFCTIYKYHYSNDSNTEQNKNTVELLETLNECTHDEHTYCTTFYNPITKSLIHDADGKITLNRVVLGDVVAGDYYEFDKTHVIINDNKFYMCKFINNESDRSIYIYHVSDNNVTLIHTIETRGSSIQLYGNCVIEIPTDDEEGEEGINHTCPADSIIIHDLIQLLSSPTTASASETGFRKIVPFDTRHCTSSLVPSLEKLFIYTDDETGHIKCRSLCLNSYEISDIDTTVYENMRYHINEHHDKNYISSQIF